MGRRYSIHIPRNFDIAKELKRKYHILSKLQEGNVFRFEYYVYGYHMTRLPREMILREKSKQNEHMQDTSSID